MSWIGVMIGAGVGMTAGGLQAGLSGGSTEDILKGMAIGGGMGAAGGGIGGALAGGAGGAAAGTTGGAAAGTTGGAAGGVGGTAGAGAGALGASGNAALSGTLSANALGLSSVGGAAGAGSGVAGAGSGAIGAGLGASGNAALSGTLSANALGLSSVGGAGGVAGGAAGAGGAANAAIPSSYSSLATKAPELGWAQQAVQRMGMDPATMGGKIASESLKQGVYGAGIGALGSGLTGQDIGKGAGMGFLGGAVGGAGQSALASQAGTATGALGTAAKFAAENPNITSGLISIPTSMALNSMTTPSAEQPVATTPEWKPNIDPNRFKYNAPQWQVYQPTYYAAGGITDLDGYASQAQNTPTGGITQIPNPAEVADPEGYGQESVRMMAGGGFTGRLMDSVGDNLIQNIPLAHAFGWDSASEIPLIGGLFNKPDALPETATLTPEEKQKLMAMMAAQQGQQAGITAQQPQQMAQGGIADLGGYATGGRPNLLNGAGDGVSDDIPASIAGKQPARLAAGEYVISSRIVSELGNGSTDAGAQRLDEMVKRIQAGRSKTMGKGKEYAKDTKPYKHLPA